MTITEHVFTIVDFVIEIPYLAKYQHCPTLPVLLLRRVFIMSHLVNPLGLSCIYLNNGGKTHLPLHIRRLLE